VSTINTLLFSLIDRKQFERLCNIGLSIVIEPLGQFLSVVCAWGSIENVALATDE